VRIKTKKLYKDSVIPQYEKQFSAGFDLHAYLENGVTAISPGETKIIGTGVAFQIPQGFEIQVRPRSGLAARHSLTVVNSPGTIDCGFLDEVKVILINHGKETIIIKHGDRIAQGVLSKFDEAQFIEVDSLSGFNRGGGFGSSGV
jgi:dUTP pyrophosphatase